MKAYNKEPVKPDVVLEMTYREAQFLRRFLGSIGGDPGLSVRAVADRMTYSLRDIGVEYDDSIALQGSISCPYDPDWEKRS